MFLLRSFLFCMTKSRRQFKTWIYQRELFKCKKINDKDRLCDANFNTFNNFKRHIIQQHHISNIIFVMCMFDNKSQRIRHRSISKINKTTTSALSMIYAQNVDVQRFVDWFIFSSISIFDTHLFSQFNHDSITTICISNIERNFSTSFFSIAFFEFSLNDSKTNFFFMSIIIFNVDISLDTMFVYDVKRFKKIHQQKSIDWLFAQIKNEFDQYYKNLLDSWNTTFEFNDICVLCSKNWKHLNSLNFMILFFKNNYSRTKTIRTNYFKFDYATSLFRIVTWFDKWFRIDIELDNFFECETYKSMNVFHFCHHKNCIKHIIHEFVYINQNRKKCHRKTRFFRQNNKKNFEHCAKHNFFCMMQIKKRFWIVKSC